MEISGTQLGSRAGPPSRQGGSGVILAHDLRIDLETMESTVGGEPIGLTVQEYDLLVLLAREVGRTVSQKHLALALWGEIRPHQERHLSVLIARLRGKIAASRELRLETHRKRGYGLIPITVSNRIEGLKRAKDGLDVLDDILRYARTGAEIHPDDAERMKWYGVFQRRQTPGYFMFRLRVPNGILTAQQVTQIGRLSNRYGRGMADITTRQNLQLRWIRIEDVPAILEALDAVGLEYRQSGMDNVRNITGCPMAGLDPDGSINAAPVTRALQDAIVGNRAFSNLPRKFNISISGCRHDCATSQVNDLSLTPASRDGRAGFNVSVGGMGGRAPAFAAPLDVFVDEAEAAAFCIALVELYRDEGHRENRQSARIRFLVDEWGVERLRSELECRYGRLQRAGRDELTAFGGDHIGVARQRQPHLNAVGCLVPVGRITGDDLIRFGALAKQYGSGEIRLTNHQNILLVDVPREDLPALLAEPLLEKYSPAPSSWRRRSVACTGIDFCHYAQIDTKGSAEVFARRMAELLPLDSAVRVHWSGCQHGCGQHFVGDIGLVASQNHVGGEIAPVVDVFLGGRLGPNPKVAQRVLRDVPLPELAERVAEYLRREGLARA